MGNDKDVDGLFARYLRRLPLFPERVDSPKEMSFSPVDAYGLSRKGSQSMVSDASTADLESSAFDIADDLEKGYAPEVVLTNNVRHPGAPRENLERCSIIYQESTDEFHLMSEGLDLLLIARYLARERRFEFFFSSEAASPTSANPAASPSSKSERRRPAFLMPYNEGADEWTLLQTRCECCVHRPRHLTCEYMGKGQQVVRIQHSRRRVGKALVHHVNAHVPPLVGETQSAVWCPALTGKDLGSRSPSALPRARSGSLSPKKDRTRLPQSPEGDEPVQLCSKLPAWDSEVESLVLNFQGRNNLSSSPRNFMLCVGPLQDSQPIMQHAQIGTNTWCLDFKYPLSVVQAFAIAMSSLDWD